MGIFHITEEIQGLWLHLLSGMGRVPRVGYPMATHRAVPPVMFVVCWFMTSIVEIYQWYSYGSYEVEININNIATMFSIVHFVINPSFFWTSSWFAFAVFPMGSQVSFWWKSPRGMDGWPSEAIEAMDGTGEKLSVTSWDSMISLANE